MKFIKKTWDYVAQKLSKHYWRECYLEYCSRRYKTVDAKTLAGICECINPPYSDIVELAQSVFGGGNMHWAKMEGGDLFDDPRLAEVFYRDRKRFLSRKYLNSVVGDIGDSFHDFLMEHHSLAKEASEFKSRVAAADLQEHIILLDDNVGRKTIKFTKINVQGNIELHLGGKFNRWEFNRVKFGGTATVNIFPPHSGYPPARMEFKDNICNGTFTCLFAAVAEIYISGNIMPAVCVDAPKDTIFHNGEAVGLLLTKMIDSCSEVPRVEFSNNNIKLAAVLYPDPGRESRPDFGLGDVRFMGGNYIGRLCLAPALAPAEESTKDNGGRLPRIRSFYFSVWEHVALTSDMREVRNCKEFFIAWKNQAKKMGDDESVYRYAFQEKYFDRMLGYNWLAKLPPWLGNTLPNLLLRLLNKILPLD